MTVFVWLFMCVMALVALVGMVGKCPSCGYRRIVCLIACKEVSEQLDRLEHEQVEVVFRTKDMGEAMDFVERSRTALAQYRYFWRLNDGQAEVCRVVQVNG